jgi:hypothetical protein
LNTGGTSIFTLMKLNQTGTAVIEPNPFSPCAVVALKRTCTKTGTSINTEQSYLRAAMPADQR